MNFVIAVFGKELILASIKTNEDHLKLKFAQSNMDTYVGSKLKFLKLRQTFCCRRNRLN